MNPAAIARHVGVSYSSAYVLTKGDERGFKSAQEYREYLARKRGFENEGEYRRHLAEERGLESRYEGERFVADREGFSSVTAYREYLAQQRGFISLQHYRDHLAKMRGFGSHSEYVQCLAERRSREKKNKILSNMIEESLSTQARSQSWLARKLGVSRQTVFSYVRGRTFPREDRLRTLLDVLCVDVAEMRRLHEELE